MQRTRSNNENIERKNKSVDRADPPHLSFLFLCAFSQFSLSEVSSIRPLEPTAKEADGEMFCFLVSQAPIQCVLRCKNEEERKKWLDALAERSDEWRQKRRGEMTNSGCARLRLSPLAALTRQTPFFYLRALTLVWSLLCRRRVTVAVTAKTQGLSGRTTEAPAAATSGPTTGHSLPVDVSDADVTGSMRPPEGPQSPAPSSEASAAISAAEVWRNCETQESDDDELSEVDEAEDLTRVEEFDEADQVEEIHLT